MFGTKVPNGETNKWDNPTSVKKQINKNYDKAEPNLDFQEIINMSGTVYIYIIYTYTVKQIEHFLLQHNQKLNSICESHPPTLKNIPRMIEKYSMCW